MTAPRCSLPRVLVSALLLAVLAAGSGHAGQTLSARLLDRLAVDTALASGDRGALQALYATTERSGAARARALEALSAGARGGAARARLVEALRDPAAEVRAAAARVVGETRQRPLEREVLRLVAEDPDPRTRVAALAAVRGWSRQGHLYFLEEALNAPWPEVQAAGLQNLARLQYRELPPEVSSRAAALAGAGSSPRVRRQALGALGSWGRLTWGQVREVAADPAAPDALRLYALELSRGLPVTEGRDELLLDVLASESSLPLAWAAFRGLSAGNQGAAGSEEAVRRYLLRTAERNTATEAMASYLGHAGYRVDYRAGAWQIGNR